MTFNQFCDKNQIDHFREAFFRHLMAGEARGDLITAELTEKQFEQQWAAFLKIAARNVRLEAEGIG